MTSKPAPSRTVKTAKTVFDIIEAISTSNGATVSEVSDEVDMAISTVFDHLSTLEELEYVVNDEGTYFVGLKFLQHGIRARNKLEVLRTARGPLEEVAETTNEVTWLVVEEHGEAVFIDKAMGEKAVQTMGRVGRRCSLNTTAAGKAILAHLPPERIDSILGDRELTARTTRTIVDPNELREELGAIRDRGMAFNEEESNPGVKAVASPILCDGHVRGALAVSGPKNRLSNQDLMETIKEELQNAVNVIELNMEHGLE